MSPIIERNYLVCTSPEGDWLRVEFGVYLTGQLAISLFDEETGEPYAVPSLASGEIETPKSHVLIKDYGEHESIYKILTKAHIIEPPVKTHIIGPYKSRVHQCPLSELSESFIDLLKAKEKCEAKEEKSNDQTKH